MGIEARHDVGPMLRRMLEGATSLAGSAAECDESALSEVFHSFAAELDDRAALDAAHVRESVTRTLPKGVELEALKRERAGFVVTSSFVLRLDDLRQLPIIRVAFEPGLLRQAPFGDLRIVDLEQAILVEGMPPPLTLNPEVAHAAGAAAHAIALTLDVRLPLLESNHSEVVEGAGLCWRFDLARLAARSESDQSWIRARFAAPS